MQMVIRGKNVEVAEPLREYIEKKIGKLRRYINVPDGAAAQINLELERGDRHIMEVTLPVEGLLLRGEVVTGDWFASVDQVAEILERQWAKWKTRVLRRQRGARDAAAAADDSDADDADEDVGRVVRHKRFPVKPMPLEEAVLQMNLLGHDFFVFTNAETEQINVVYRRHDGNFGLLEPEV